MRRSLMSGMAMAALAASLAPMTDAASPQPIAGEAARLGWEVLSRRPHDDSAFTQGLILGADGRLFESTGDFGRSTLREVDPVSGRVLRSVSLPDDVFGEGLAFVDDHLVQLTWRSGTATRWDVATLEPVATYGYEGEGWGLCYDGQQLVMSDGSDELTVRDAQSFAVLDVIAVTLDGEPRDRLNELECVDGSVWANIFGSDTIVRIDAASGNVTGLLELRGILEPHPRLDDRRAVLNGIAYDPSADTFLVTGKHWPELIEIRVREPGTTPP